MRAGDEDALRSLFQSLAPSGYALAQRIAGAHAAEAILEEVFLLLWREPQQWSGAALELQLLRCIRDTAVAVWRRKISAAAALAQRRAPAIEPAASPAPVGRGSSERARAALFALAEAERELLEAAWFEGADIDELAQHRNVDGDAAAAALTAALTQLADAGPIETVDAAEPAVEPAEAANGDPQLGAVVLGLADPERLEGAADGALARRLASAAVSLALTPNSADAAAYSAGIEHRIIARARTLRAPAARRLRLRRSLARRLGLIALLAAALGAAAVFAWLAFEPRGPISGQALPLSEDGQTGVLLPRFEQRPFALVFWGLPAAQDGEVWQLWLVSERGAVSPGPSFTPNAEGRAAVAINPAHWADALESGDTLIGLAVSLDDPEQRSSETPARESIRYQFPLD